MPAGCRRTPAQENPGHSEFGPPPWRRQGSQAPNTEGFLGQPPSLSGPRRPTLGESPSLASMTHPLRGFAWREPTNAAGGGGGSKKMASGCRRLTLPRERRTV